MPTHSTGTWSIRFALSCLAFFVLGVVANAIWYTTAVSGDSLIEDITQRPVLAICMLLGALSGILGFVVGLVSIVKYKERSKWVYVVTVFGGLILLFLLGESLG